MLNFATEIFLLGVLAYTISELWDMPEEVIGMLKEIKKAQGLQSQRQKSKYSTTIIPYWRNKSENK